MKYTSLILQGIPRRPLTLLLLTLLLFNVVAWFATFGLDSLRPGIFALAGLAWFFGARHAFDIDHIAAIDNVTRKLRQEGRHPVGVGFFFALGHSTIVIALTAAIALGIHGLKGDELHALAKFGSIFGTGISAAFLMFIGIINLIVLLQLIKALRDYLQGHDVPALKEANINALLGQRGFFYRAFHFLFLRVNKSWHMYPVGILFGLGFDTATEVAIIAITATLASTSHMPVWGIMIFPFLFTAGMTLMDSLDGLVMLRAYHWALSDGLRRLYFNTTITAMAVIIALGVGTLEWLQIVGVRLGLTDHGGFWHWIEGVNFSLLGIAAVIIMLFTWAISVVYYRWRIMPQIVQNHRSSPVEQES